MAVVEATRRGRKGYHRIRVEVLHWFSHKPEPLVTEQLQPRGLIPAACDESVMHAKRRS